MRLSKQQLALTKSTKKMFLEGAAGTGKTTVGVRRMLRLLEDGVPGSSILILVPQRALAHPYERELKKPKLAAGGKVTIMTLGSMAQQMVDLFFPLVAEDVGFRLHEQRPTFLSLETAQYYMRRVIGPIIDEKGYFETITIDRNRLYSQLLDNLNKAAVVGFPYEEIGQRLKAAWTGDTAQQHVYEEVQVCINHFRAYCLENNLLDFSLQVELLNAYLWQIDACRSYLTSRYRHLIVENVEEDAPAMHYLLKQWIPIADSALVIYDTQSGFRSFLGSDPNSAYTLKSVCEQHATLDKSYVISPDVSKLGIELSRSLNREIPLMPDGGNARSALMFDHHRYHPQMIDWVTGEIIRLIRDEGVSPSEIVVVAPYLPDALRFALMNRLEGKVPVRSHRPSRSLREEPAAQCLLTLAQLAHPDWGVRPASYDVTYALMQAIEGLDLSRAQLLAKIVHRQRDGGLTSFNEIKETAVQERITYVFGSLYETLREWIETYKQNPLPELDFFFSRLFGEVLSQKGFGFHRHFDAAEVAANLIDSARNFRRTVQDFPEGITAAQEYVEVVLDGVIADQYIRRWNLKTEDAVLLAPAYTFLMVNQPVDYQFWLNVGSGAWWERLYQPLTHHYVLSKGWTEDRVWTDADEFEVRQEAMHKVTLGLIRRCRKKIYLGFSEIGESGSEQRGPLLEAFQRMLRRLSSPEAANV